MKTELLMGLVLLAGGPATQDDVQDQRTLGEVAPAAGETGSAETAAQVPDGRGAEARPGTDSGARTPEAWRRALSADDLGARLEAYEALLAGARDDADTRALLEAWSGEQGELGWTARLALRELELRAEHGEAQAFGQGREEPFGRPGRGGPLDRGRAFGGPFGGGAFGPFGAAPFGGDPFGGTSDLLRDMEEQLGALLQGGGFGGNAFGAHGPGSGGLIEGQSQSLRMESGPDGVRVEVQEQDEDGNTQKKTYEAGSLDELLELHPELRGRLQASSPGAGWNSGVRDLFDRLRERRGAAPYGSVAVPTEKLGILMREPGSFTSSAPGLDEDTGLYVERVLPGTLAAELGIRPGDVLTHLDGRALSSAEDVQAALSARRPSDRLTAEVVDARGERRELSWRPPAKDLRQL